MGAERASVCDNHDQLLLADHYCQVKRWASWREGVRGPRWWGVSRAASAELQELNGYSHQWLCSFKGINANTSAVLKPLQGRIN